MIEWVTLAFIIFILWVIITRRIKKFVERRNLNWINIPIPGLVLLRTTRTGLFDTLSHFKRTFHIYERISIGIVLLSAVFMLITLVFGVIMMAITKPEPTGIFAVQNMLVLPGINAFIPSSFAVWFGLVICIFIHEFGHGVISRVEDIRVKYTGVVIAVIPIGFFVDPDEVELAAAPRSSRAGLFSAGVANNILFGLLCFMILMAIIGFAIPRIDPQVYATLEKSPVNIAGMKPGFTFTSLNGIPVSSQHDVQIQLASAQEGSVYTISGRALDGTEQTYTITMDPSKKLGIYFYPAESFIRSLGFNLKTFFGMLLAPVSIISQNSKLGVSADPMFSIFAFGGGHTSYYNEPFPFFWAIIQLIFWSGWFSLNVGIFNALPMLPLDGGLVVKEYLEPLVGNIPHIGKHSRWTMRIVSSIVFLLLIEMITLPYQFKLFGI